MPPNDPLTFDVSVETGQFAARQALESLLAALEPLALDFEEKSTIELVLAEALNNIVEHAYPGPDATGRIELSVSVEGDGLHFTLRDYGMPMPDGKMPIGSEVDIDLDLLELPEGGFGWFLIRDLAKEVAYAREGDSNVLTLRLAISKQA